MFDVCFFLSHFVFCYALFQSRMLLRKRVYVPLRLGIGSLSSHVMWVSTRKLESLCRKTPMRTCLNDHKMHHRAAFKVVLHLIAERAFHQPDEFDDMKTAPSFDKVHTNVFVSEFNVKIVKNFDNKCAL